MRRALIGAICLVLAACGGGAVASPSGLASGQVPARPSPSEAAASATPTASIDLISELDALVAGFQGFQGSALVALGDRILLSKGYGMADAAKGIRNAPETRFRLASLTKQFTAMAILILQSQGKLDVKDAACTYLPDCPSAWRAITIHQLLSHTSGLPDFTELPDFESIKNQPSTAAQTLARIKGLPLDFAPGQGFHYNNSGYAALGSIVERVSGMAYEAFLRQEIFGPLGMRDTGYDTGAGRLATGYKNATTVADPTNASVYLAAGGLYSTVLDMHRWDQALYTDRLMPKDLLATMFQPMTAIPDVPNLRYGYGVYVGTMADRPFVGHDGAVEGSRTYYGRHPDDRLSVILLSNVEGEVTYEELDRSITQLVLDR